jgi:peptide/nickel transport system permease protein
MLATVLSLALGAMAGVIAGYFGGWRDQLVMRLVELFLALPWLYLLLTVRALLPLSFGPQQTFLMLAGVIGIVGWARPARMVRGVVRSLRERPYVVAARGFGASDWHLFKRHILPDLGGLLLTQAAILVPQYVLAEVALSFVGVGVAEPAASWGGLLAYLRQLSVLACCAWMALPCCFLVLTFASFQKLADQVLFRSGSIVKNYEAAILELE